MSVPFFPSPSHSLLSDYFLIVLLLVSLINVFLVFFLHDTCYNAVTVCVVLQHVLLESLLVIIYRKPDSDPVGLQLSLHHTDL